MGGMPEDIHTNFAVEDIRTVTPPAAVEEDADDGTPPLWKQAVGAVVGSLVALALYATYEAAAPAVTGWLSGDPTHAAAERHQEESVSAKKVSTGARQKRTNP